MTDRPDDLADVLTRVKRNYHNEIGLKWQADPPYTEEEIARVDSRQAGVSFAEWFALADALEAAQKEREDAKLEARITREENVRWAEKTEAAEARAAELEKRVGQVQFWRSRAESAEDRVRQLEEALRKIADGEFVTRKRGDPIPATIDGRASSITYVEGLAPWQIARDVLAAKENTTP